LGTDGFGVDTVKMYRKEVEKGAYMKRTLLFLAVLLIAATGLWTDAASDREAAANRGDAREQHNIGVDYATGDGREKDYRTVADWFDKALNNSSAGDEVKSMARENLGECYYYIGRMYNDAKDYREAFLWYLKNAETSHGSGYLALVDSQY
jgi:TPR repeat protein